MLNQLLHVLKNKIYLNNLIFITIKFSEYKYLYLRGKSQLKGIKLLVEIGKELLSLLYIQQANINALRVSKLKISDAFRI